MFRDKYTNFSFNDLRSENFKVWITNKADLKRNMTPDFTDKFNTPTYGKIRYYEGTTVEKQDIDIQCVAVNITANEWRAITNWLSPLAVGKLRFEWNPHYYYVVKLSKAISGEYWSLNSVDPILGNLFNVTFSISFTTVYDWAALSSPMEDIVLRSLPQQYIVSDWSSIKTAEVGEIYKVNNNYYECIKKVTSSSNSFNDAYWKDIGVNSSIFNNSYLVPTIVSDKSHKNLVVSNQGSFSSRVFNTLTTFKQNFNLDIRDMFYYLMGQVTYDDQKNKLLYKHYVVPHINSLANIKYPEKDKIYCVGTQYYKCTSAEKNKSATYTLVTDYIENIWEENLFYTIDSIDYITVNDDTTQCSAGSWYFYKEKYYLCSENTTSASLSGHSSKTNLTPPANIIFKLSFINNETVIITTVNTTLYVTAGANEDVTQSCWCQNVGAYDGYPIVYSNIPYALKDNNTTYCNYDYNGEQSVAYNTVLNSQYHTLSANGVPLDTLINGIGVPVYKNINNAYQLTIPSGRPQLLKTILYDYKNIIKTISDEDVIHSTVFEFLINDRPVYDRYKNFILTISRLKGVSNIYDVNNYGENNYSISIKDSDYVTILNPEISYFKDKGGWKMRVVVPSDKLLGKFAPSDNDINKYFYISLCDAYAIGFKVDEKNIGNISVAMQARDVI